MESKRRYKTEEKIDQLVCTQFFSWTPIIIGALVSVGLGFLLKLFANSMGLTLYTTDTTGATILAIVGFLVLLSGSIATMFIAGFAAGYFAAPTCPSKNFGVVYGFLAWCLGLLLASLLTSSMSHYVNYETRGTTYSPTVNEMAVTSERVASTLHPATDRSDTYAERNVRTAGMASLAMFFLFFAGALSATFGGYFGFACWRNVNEYDET